MAYYSNEIKVIAAKILDRFWTSQPLKYDFETENEI